MRRAIWAGAAVAVCLFTAGQASAAIYDINAVGTLASGSDPDNIFATGSSDLGGAAYDENILVDTSKGVYATDSQLYGFAMGGYFDSYLFNTTTSFPLTGSLEVNGVTVDINGQIRDQAMYDENLHIDQGGVDYNTKGLSSVDGKSYTADLDLSGIAFSPSPEIGVDDPILTGTGSIYDSAFSVGTASGQGDLFNTVYTVTILDPTGGPSRVVSAAPEPSSWALMMLGVGGIGLMLRSARKRLPGAVAA